MKPSGPLHKIVLAFAIFFENSATVFGPTSQIKSPCHRKSDGIKTFFERENELISFTSFGSLSRKDFFTSIPRNERIVFAGPPPSKNQSARFLKNLIASSLSAAFAPPTMKTNGCLGFFIIFERDDISFSSVNPA